MTQDIVHADVVVVGGGPVGSLLAVELARTGISVLVLEAAAKTVDVPKAGTVHARCVQALGRRGYLPAPDVRAAAQVTDFHYAGFMGLMIESPAGEGEAIMGLSQGQLERHFHKLLLGFENATVMRSAEALEVGQDADGVRVSFRHEGRERVAHALWVVGSDGARSVVRKSIGFSVTETAPTASAIVGVAQIQTPARAAVPYGWHFGPRGWTVISYSPLGVSRLLAMDFHSPIPDRRTPVTEAEFVETLARLSGQPIPIERISYLSRFSDYSRLVDNCRQGRALLVGDAAHVHFPLGGQGMNLGMIDAIELGWKLGAVVRGDISESVLDLYAAMRHEAGRRVLSNVADQTIRMRSAVELQAEPEEISRMMRDPLENARVGRMVSGQLSPASTTLSAPEAGRFLSNARIELPDGTQSSIVEALSVRSMPMRIPAPHAEGLLLGPDGIVYSEAELVRHGLSAGAL
ncbi:MAG: FAD-dependent monooxygenase [Lautropia sp.]|nr:FAD-dependent monooxygenase [Lautropia sp.]